MSTAMSTATVVPTTSRSVPPLTAGRRFAGLTLYAMRVAVEDAVLARAGDGLSPDALCDEVLLEVESQLGCTRGELLAEGLDQFVDALASRGTSRTRAEAA